MHKITAAGITFDLDCFVGTVTQVSPRHCELTDANDNVKIFNIDKLDMPLPRLGDSVQITTAAGLPAIFSNFSSDMQYANPEILTRKYRLPRFWLLLGGLIGYPIIGEFLLGSGAGTGGLMLALLQTLVAGISAKRKFKRLDKEIWALPEKIRQVVYPNN